MATRSDIWRDEEVKELIAIWSEEHIQSELQKSVNNKPVYKDIPGSVESDLSRFVAKGGPGQNQVFSFHDHAKAAN